MEVKDVIIIGGGPAGLSAAIYSVRNGLKTLILEKGMCGGMTVEAPWIENYLGFEKIKGMELAEKFKSHASKYVDINEFESVNEIKKDEGFIVTTDKAKYTTQSLILAMGTVHVKLGVKGENEFLGKGVSYCATCDGFFFKQKKVLIVGGGNSAVIDAIQLHDIGCKVSLIHRRDSLRAEQTLQKALFERGIEVIWHSVLDEIKGSDVVTGVKVRDTINGGMKELECDGVFISVGEAPNNELAKVLGVNVDNSGYIITDKRQRTNISKVYAAGDITGGVKQVIVACAEGAIAAISAYEDIKNPYWVRKQ